jgi:hypothetical protein
MISFPGQTTHKHMQYLIANKYAHGSIVLYVLQVRLEHNSHG